MTNLFAIKTNLKQKTIEITPVKSVPNENIWKYLRIAQIQSCYRQQINPFPNKPFWNHPKFKEAADDNWNVAI